MIALFSNRNKTDEKLKAETNFKRKLYNIVELSKNDFRSRYAGSFLGVLWAFIYPCITVLLYWFVFEVALGSEVDENVPYILWLVSALIPYLFFSDAILGTISSIVDYSYLVKNIKLDVYMLPVMRVISNLVIHGFFVLLMFVLSIILGYFPKIEAFWIFYYMIAEIVFIIALGMLFSAIAVFFRDIKNIALVFVQVGYWLTPLFWEINSVDSKIGILIKVINPITYITVGFREAILYGTPPEMWYTAYFWGICVLLSVACVFCFKRLAPYFSDNL